MTGKFMTIDNIPIELTGEEKNLTPSFPYTAHAACAW